tara:strand:+ start:532 stop:777 length:246 start_codon:yes stop_codon:yes gene_type:complete
MNLKEPIMTYLDEYKKVELRSLKSGAYFKRKPNAKTEFIREHYNPKSQWEGPANFACSDTEDMNRYVYLKPSTQVYIERSY